MQQQAIQTPAGLAQIEIDKVLRNTYLLLAMTLAVSAVAAFASIALQIGFGLAFGFNIAGLALIWFVLPRTANSIAGLWVTFAFTALWGAGLGPMLSHYLAMSNGSFLIMSALGSTAAAFFLLSGFVLVTRKDLSGMGGFLMVGIIVVILAMVANIFLAMPIMFLALNAAVVLLMSGFIMYHTSMIIHGGERNYILAAVGIYVALVNIFVSLLHLFGAFMGDD